MAAGDFIYHKALAEATNAHGGSAFLFVGAFRRKSDNKRMFKVLPLGVEQTKENEKVLVPENEQVDQRLADLQPGNWYTFRAYGSRQNASLRVFDANGAEIIGAPQHAIIANPPLMPPTHKPPTHGGLAYNPPTQSSVTPPQYVGTPGVPTGAGVPARGGMSEASLDNIEAMIDCLFAAETVVGRFATAIGREPTEIEQKIAVTLFIQGRR